MPVGRWQQKWQQRRHTARSSGSPPLPTPARPRPPTSGCPGT